MSEWCKKCNSCHRVVVRRIKWQKTSELSFNALRGCLLLSLFYMIWSVAVARFSLNPSALLNCCINNKADLNVTGASLQPGSNPTRTVSWGRGAAGSLAEGPDRRSWQDPLLSAQAVCCSSVIRKPSRHTAPCCDLPQHWSVLMRRDDFGSFKVFEMWLICVTIQKIWC